MVYWGNLTLFLYTGLDNGAGEKSYYIIAIAGLTNSSSLVVMSKGMKVTISCYYSCLWLEPPFSDHFPTNCKKYPNISLGLCLLTPIFSESFPYKWINRKWKELFHVTSKATAGNRWGGVMSRNSGYSNQAITIACPYAFFCSICLPIYIPLCFPLTAAWIFTSSWVWGLHVLVCFLV